VDPLQKMKRLGSEERVLERRRGLGAKGFRLAVQGTREARLRTRPDKRVLTFRRQPMRLSAGAAVIVVHYFFR